MCWQAAREAALRHELEAWQAREADRAAAEAEERERQAAQAAVRAAELQKADAIKEAARQKERTAWTALRAAEARCGALQMESAQYGLLFLLHVLCASCVVLLGDLDGYGVLQLSGVSVCLLDMLVHGMVSNPMACE